MELYDFSYIRFRDKINIGNLKEVKNIYNKKINSKNPHVEITVLRIALYDACNYNHLDIAQWVYSLIPDTFITANNFYESLFMEICNQESIHKNYIEMIKWIYSVKPITLDIDYIIEHVFEKLLIKLLREFENTKYASKKTQPYQSIEFIKYFYELNPNMTDRIIASFLLAGSYNHVEIAEWLYKLRPNHFILVLDEKKENIIKYEVLSEKDIKWNKRKTVIYMSQTKMQPSNFFRFVSDDVVRVMLEYV